MCSTPVALSAGAPVALVQQVPTGFQPPLKVSEINFRRFLVLFFADSGEKSTSRATRVGNDNQCVSAVFGSVRAVASHAKRGEAHSQRNDQLQRNEPHIRVLRAAPIPKR
jgi:hypothetical protein